MKMGFWNTIQRPAFVLAPMADVTDAAFRRVIAKYSRRALPGGAAEGGPDAMWTEFVSADGLFLGPDRDMCEKCAAGGMTREEFFIAASDGGKLSRDLIYSEEERPIVAQFFTSKPALMEKAAALARGLGFDGVDINMGCPDRSIERSGAGAALMKKPELAVDLIRAAKSGAGDLPVSVKTRIGYNKDELDAWLPALLAEDVALITVHARTRKEMSSVPARWERVRRATEIRNEMAKDTLIFGNGDALDLDDAREKAAESGADGVMLGRAIFGKPWLFSGSHEMDDTESPAIRAKALRIMIEHTKLFDELLGGAKNFAIMKKHYKAYANNFPGASELRAELMQCEKAEEVESVTEKYIKGLYSAAAAHGIG